MKRLLRILAASLTAMTLTTGVVGAQSATISNTGPDSHNDVNIDTHMDREVRNYNDIIVANTNPQHAFSGEAEVEHNTTGGDAISGVASNASTLSVKGTISNTAAGTNAMNTNGLTGTMSGSISQTGPDSHNDIDIDTHNSVEIKNHNDITITNLNEQCARSGSAEVKNNTTGGSAKTGDAKNVSTTEAVLTLSN